MTRQGRIQKGVGGIYYLRTSGGEVYACRAKGIFRRTGIRPLPGDEALFEILDEKEKEGSLKEILPRKNVLVRPQVANADQALVIFSIHDPEPNLLLLDRFLTVMERQGLPSLIVFSKADLADEEEIRAMREVYQDAGYPLFFTGLPDGRGVEELKKALDGRTTVVAGPSGAGKSSLINRLQDGVLMETGQISRKLKRGKHTTRHAQLIWTGEDTVFVDTPGFTALYLPEMEEEELAPCFHEFAPWEGDCRFQGCRHDKEPDCSVRKAVLDGKVSRSRYGNYCLLLEEIRQRPRY